MFIAHSSMTKRFRRSGTSDKLLMFTFNEYLFFFNVSDSNILSNVIKIVLIHYFLAYKKVSYIQDNFILNVIITNIVFVILYSEYTTSNILYFILFQLPYSEKFYTFPYK